MTKFEYQYAASIDRILKHGLKKTNRTGIDTISVEHQYFHIPRVNRFFPRINGKMIYPKLALKELIWMLQGRTDIAWLNKHKVNYWNEWANENGTIGKSYGYQYRNFNGVDQLQRLLDGMINNPDSRRHILNIWNVSDLDEMSLPPCMYNYHFSMLNAGGLLFGNRYKINLHVTIRSNDSFLGCPYDVMFCVWMLHIICKYLKSKRYDNEYIPGDIHYTANDYHLYENHFDQALQYLDNVKENKFGIIDSNCHLIDESEISTKLTLNEYLKEIENNFDKFSISANFDSNNRQVNFKYPKIQAPVAI